MAPQVRIRKAGECALLNPATGIHECPGVNDYYDADHPLVLAHPWAFATDAQVAAEVTAARQRTSVPVEQATAAPGERRIIQR
jgi:hypothetical protein